MGTIVTYYSYKGGVGRTMALANMAVLLAKWNYKVLIVDWDLEAPGLEYYYSDFLDVSSVHQNKGLIDLLSGVYESGYSKETEPVWRDYVIKIPLGDNDAADGTAVIDFINSGRKDKDYFKRVINLDIETFYAQKNGWEFFEYLRDQWKEEYDFVLVDARTGITDVSGICTVQLPDKLMVLFNATEQSFTGAKDVAEKAYRSQKKLPFDRYRLEIVPVPSRFDSQKEFKISQQWLDRFAEELKDIYDDWLPTSIKPRRLLEMIKIPYIPYFSFGEKLPVLEQGTDDPSGLGYAYETLAALIAKNLGDVESLIEEREYFIRKASSKKIKKKPKIYISYTHRDRKWVEQLRTHLSALGIGNETWYGEEIKGGQEWFSEIQEAIDSSQVFILLISADYLNSDYIQKVEIPALLKRKKLSGAVIVPVIVSPFNWKLVPWLKKFQVFPGGDKPLSLMSESERAKNLVDLTTMIAEMLKNDTGKENEQPVPA